MSVHDLLLALMLPSADDAAEDLAYNVGHGSVARFRGDDERRGAGSSGCATRTTRRRSASTRRATTRPPPIWSSWPATTSTHSPYFARDRRAPAAPCCGPGRTSATWSTATTWSAEFPWIDGVKTGHTAGRRLRAGRVRASARHDAAQRRARDLERGRARRQHAGAARLRVRQLPTSSRPSAPARCWPGPPSSYRPGEHAALVAAAPFTAWSSRAGARAGDRARAASS